MAVLYKKQRKGEIQIKIPRVRPTSLIQKPSAITTGACFAKIAAVKQASHHLQVLVILTTQFQGQQ